MNQPKLSVIVPNYNHAAYVGEQLNAIVQQSYQPLEILVIDDCSTDNSREVLNEWVEENPLIKLVSNEKNLGINDSFNRAVEMASGEYLCCCPADDRVLLDFFAKSMDLLGQYPKASLCCSIPAFLDDETGIIDRHDDWYRVRRTPSYLSPQELVDVVGPNSLWIAGVSCIFKRNIFIQSGKYINGLRWYSDWFIWHVMAFRYGICYIPEALAAIRVLPTSYSEMGRKDTQAETEVIQYLVKLLRSEQYKDVLASFKDSQLLDNFSFSPVLKRVLSYTYTAPISQ